MGAYGNRNSWTAIQLPGCRSMPDLPFVLAEYSRYQLAGHDLRLGKQCPSDYWSSSAFISSAKLRRCRGRTNGEILSRGAKLLEAELCPLSQNCRRHVSRRLPSSHPRYQVTSRACEADLSGRAVSKTTDGLRLGEMTSLVEDSCSGQCGGATLLAIQKQAPRRRLQVTSMSGWGQRSACPRARRRFFALRSSIIDACSLEKGIRRGLRSRCCARSNECYERLVGHP
jgi:hypothetical protein